MTKLAVILLNMGGPDSLSSVKPFLFNLFNDPAIINLPFPVRWLLAKHIARKRTPVAQKIYAAIGGKSPLLDISLEQAKALEILLNQQQPARVFVAMRYWRPTSRETAKKVAAYQPDEIVLLPLYPQYSSATSGSSIKDWRSAALKAGINTPTYTVCCYPNEPGFIESLKKHTETAIKTALQFGAPRVLFSAHGLPEKMIKRGDPYLRQVERTVASLVKALGVANLDWKICYQSRIGRQAWIKPYAEEEIRRAALEKIPLVIVPVAFVSEHAETLVELDMEYRETAMKLGAPAYIRVPTVQISKEFIAGLANLVVMAKTKKQSLISMDVKRLCENACRLCPHG